MRPRVSVSLRMDVRRPCDSQGTRLPSGRALRSAWPLVLLVAACGSKDARAPVGTDDRPIGAHTQRTGSESSVSGWLVASVGERSLGPFLARRGSGPAAVGLVAWMSAAEGASRRVIVVPVGTKGAPTGAETAISNVSLDTTALVVRPMRGPTPGFVVAWTSLTDRGKSLWSVTVNDDGVPRSKPIELTRTTDDIVWIEAIPTEHGAVCLWAEETRGSDANLIAAAIDSGGKVHGTPTRIARGIVGWHALELPDGVGLSIVEPPADAKSMPAEGHASGGTLAFQRIDADGQPGSRTVVMNRPIVSGDVEVAREPNGRLVFAWTDRTTAEPAVVLAALDDKNVLDPPRKVMEARGGASLLALASGTAGTALMFEAPARRKGDSRRVHVVRVGPDLALGPPTSIDTLGRGQPELAPTASGFALLATSADCEQNDTACLNADSVATLFRTDADGTLLQREPLTFLSDPATLGWGMTCDGDTCFTLAVSPGTPSRVRAVAVRPRTNVKTVAAKSSTSAEPSKTSIARVADVSAFASGESVVDIAATHFGEASIVATLTSKPTERVRRGVLEDARTASLTLSTQLIDANGGAQPAAIITTHALAAGGVAIAPGATDDDGGAVAWVARDNGDPEVHVTRIDKHGRKTSDVQLTTTKGDASDVTITWANSGWIVAWVDGRDGNGEVYATKLGPDLRKIAKEERITKAPGDASDLVALANGDMVWLAWSDSRESPKDGVADVYVSAVKMRDAKPAIDDQRLLATAAHSRTPQLTSGPTGMYVAWIEEAPMGSETPAASGYGAFWAKLDASGKPTEKPARIPLSGDGAATSIAIEATPWVRALVTRSTPDMIAIDAVDLSVTPSIASALLSLDGPPSLDVALALDRGVLFFNDEGPRPADRRARRARIAWQEK